MTRFVVLHENGREFARAGILENALMAVLAASRGSTGWFDPGVAVAVDTVTGATYTAKDGRYIGKNIAGVA